MKSQAKQSLVWGGLLILLGTISLVETFTDMGAWIWVAALVLGGAGVYGIYAIDRAEKLMLVISYVLFAVAFLVALLTLNLLPDPIIPTFVLLAIALLFFVAFLNSGRTNWGLLIPVYILFAVSVMVPLITTGMLSGILVAAYVLFAIAIPFFAVFARDSKKWWALIPGGITAIIGLSFLVAKNAAQYVVPAFLIIAGVWVVMRAIVGKKEERT